jgi:hypothetical protein
VKINTEEQAYLFIEKWRDCSIPAQINALKKTLESLELAHMYYEQKENEKGMQRTERCIKIIKTRREELV